MHEYSLHSMLSTHATRQQLLQDEQLMMERGAMHRDSGRSAILHYSG